MTAYYVKHKYRYRSGRSCTCVRCGVKRRRARSGWQWWYCGMWQDENPFCARKP